MWVRTTAIIAVLGVAALTLVSAFPPSRAQSPMQPATLTWDEPNFSIYRVVADDNAVMRSSQKLAPRRDRSKVDAAIAELIRKRAEERRRRQAPETATTS